MGDPVSDSARAAAERLAAEVGTQVVTDVEAALHDPELAQRPEQYLDPISLGGLIVSIATLAWTVYNDLKNRTPKPDSEAIARKVRVELPTPHAPSAVQRDHIIEVVITETIRIAESHAQDRDR
jgi:hypothetical protein